MNEEAVYNLVLETLRQASSQDPQLLNSAEERLKAWTIEPGFHTYLINIVNNRTIEYTVRWLAVLCLKNGVEKYWRKQCPNGISEPEKQTIRQLLLYDFQERVPQIELQIAVVISKIARYDWPNDWPDLVPTLIAAVQNADIQTQEGALITWKHVIKSLSSKRLFGDKRMFQELTKDLFPFMIEVYTAHMKRFISESTDSKQLRKCLICVKIIKILIVSGFKKPNESPHVVQFISDVFPQIGTMLQLENHQSIDKDILYKYVINLLKVLLQFHEHHPFSFLPFLKCCLEFCVSFAFSMQNNQDYSLTQKSNDNKLMISTLNLLKNVILCAEYNNPCKNTDIVPETQQAMIILKEFFTRDLLEQILFTLVTRFLPLTPQELMTWDEDPEASTCDEGGESYRYSIRPCVETLFVTIFQNHRDVLTQPLVQLLNEYKGPVDPKDIKRILIKDAVYNAIGLAAFDLYDDIDLDDWFQTTLRIEMQIKTDNYRIIRKRVAWLLGNWSNVKFSSTLRPALYESLLPLMAPDEDLAVRLAACRAFKMCVDDFEFNTEQFLPFVGIYFNNLYKLLCDAKECDTKMHVLNVCTYLIERMGSSISGFADDIFESLPMLWAQSAEHNLLRCAIVTTLTQLTIAAGKVHSIVPQVIKYCTDTEQEQFLYMIEDALELWIAVLNQSPVLTPDLNELFPCILAVLKDSGEHYTICSKILRAYILLDPMSFYADKVNATVSLLCTLLPELKFEGFSHLLQIVELCIRVVPNPPLGSLHPILSMLITFLLEVTDRTHGYKQSLLLCCLSRIILLDPSYFLLLIQDSATRSNKSVDEMLSNVLDDIIQKLNIVTQYERRKIIGLALCSLLTSKSPIVLSKFTRIMEQLTDVMNDVLIVTQDNVCEDTLTDLTDVYEGRIPTEHQERKKKIAQFDPVYKVHIHIYVQEKLNELCLQIGTDSFRSLVSTLNKEVKDKDLLDNLKHYVNLC